MNSANNIFTVVLHEVFIALAWVAIGYVLTNAIPPETFFNDVGNIYVIAIMCIAGYFSHFYDGTFVVSLFVLAVFMFTALVNDAKCGHMVKDALRECKKMVESGELVVTYFALKFAVLGAVYFGVVASKNVQTKKWS